MTIQSHKKHRPNSLKSSVAVFITALLATTFCGCNEKLQTGYGRAKGDTYYGSVNGTFDFARNDRSQRA